MKIGSLYSMQNVHCFAISMKCLIITITGISTFVLAFIGFMRKLTALIAKQIVNLVGGGCFIADAAGAVGVSKNTLYNWIRVGRQAAESRDEGGEVKPDDIACYKLYRAIQKAKTKGVRYLLGKIKKATDKDWHAAAWILERKDPRRWGRNKLELTELYAQIRELRNEVDALYFGGIGDDPEEASDSPAE